VIVSIVVLALFLIVLVVSHQQRSTARPLSRDEASLQRALDTGRFHAVSIRSSEDGCSAAYAMRGQRFLDGAAPRLPLADCDAGQCNCRYVHHADRRDGADRRSPFQSGFGGSAARVAEDLRSNVDRRSHPSDGSALSQ
jgi:hypothetical protein